VASVEAHPEALDETVVHDPHGRPWLVCTVDLLCGPLEAESWYPEDTAALIGRYETQVYYTARAGMRGFPTGHGERFMERSDAMVGHRRWCLSVRHGGVLPDLAPEQPL
jgi:hypothetical protein